MTGGRNYLNHHIPQSETNVPTSRYGDIEEVMKSKIRLDEDDIAKVLLNLINRRRFDYRVRDIVEYIGKCVCLRKKAGIRANFKNHEMFQSCEEKMEKELDIVHLLK